MVSQKYTALATIIGAVIGAGILGIPYVVAQSGFLIGFITLILVGVIIGKLTLYLGEIALRTNGNHHMTGYAEKYLGRRGKKIMFITFAFGIYSALIAYLVGEGESLSMLFTSTPNYALHAGILFWLALTAFTYNGLSSLKDGELKGTTAIILLIVGILILFWNKIELPNLTTVHLEKFHVPLGVVIFAFLGFSAIPETTRILQRNKKSLKNIITASYIIVFLAYTIFTLTVVGSQGTQTPQIATLNLGKIFILLGIATMFTSYLALATALIDTLQFDYQITKKRAWLITSLPSVFIYIFLTFYQVATFTTILGIGGVISGGLTTALILLMMHNARKNGKRRPEYTTHYSRITSWIIIIILAIATILEIANAL